MEFLPILTTITGIGMSIGYFTQTYKIFKRKSAIDVSLGTYLFFGVGVMVWLIYGISLNNYVLIITNVVALVGALSVIISYFLNKH